MEFKLIRSYLKARVTKYCPDVAVSDMLGELSWTGKAYFASITRDYLGYHQGIRSSIRITVRGPGSKIQVSFFQDDDSGIARKLLQLICEHLHGLRR